MELNKAADKLWEDTVVKFSEAEKKPKKKAAK